jgi:hypothetical protein
MSDHADDTGTTPQPANALSDAFNAFETVFLNGIIARLPEEDQARLIALLAENIPEEEIRGKVAQMLVGQIKTELRDALACFSEGESGVQLKELLGALVQEWARRQASLVEKQTEGLTENLHAYFYCNRFLGRAHNTPDRLIRKTSWSDTDVSARTSSGSSLACRCRGLCR